MTPILEIRGVSKRFSVRRGLFAPKRTLTAVAGVSATLPRGEVLGLVGESGCGKSTLAKMVLGLETPSEGEVLVDGRPIASLGRLEHARLVQPVFQDPYSSLNPRRRVGAIVGQPLDVHAEGTPAERRTRIEQMLALVGLTERHARAYPNQLSGGQRRCWRRSKRGRWSPATSPGSRPRRPFRGVTAGPDWLRAGAHEDPCH